MNLNPFIEQIRNLDPSNQSIRYNSALWSNFIFMNNEIFMYNFIDEDIAFIVEKYPGRISRSDIINYLSSDGSSLRRGFLMSMIWGHGAGENGRADNRGPWKVSKMLEDLPLAESILYNASLALDENDLIRAHKAFKKMPRCRVNFFSKFLYFLGKSKQMKKYPLIFDARVAGTLLKLNSTDPEMNMLVKVEPSQDPIAYRTYVHRMHELALEYNVEADKIELFLFNGIG